MNVFLAFDYEELILSKLYTLNRRRQFKVWTDHLILIVKLQDVLLITLNEDEAVLINEEEKVFRYFAT